MKYTDNQPTILCPRCSYVIPTSMKVEVVDGDEVFKNLVSVLSNDYTRQIGFILLAHARGLNPSGSLTPGILDAKSEERNPSLRAAFTDSPNFWSIQIQVTQGYLVTLYGNETLYSSDKVKVEYWRNDSWSSFHITQLDQVAEAMRLISQAYHYHKRVTNSTVKKTVSDEPLLFTDFMDQPNG